jgi:hypothetical protein
MTQQYERDPRNSRGDFYVVRDQCVTCLMPATEAPDLMGFDEESDSGCYFKRQPANAIELDQAVYAIQVACCGALRYGGSSSSVIQKLKDLGEANQCDAVMPYKYPEPPFPLEEFQISTFYQKFVNWIRK